MRLVLIADVFPPLRSSGAVQLRDLSRELVLQGHDVTVLTPAPDQSEPWLLEEASGVRIVRLRAPRTRDTSYVRRAIGEFMMPFVMRRNFLRSPLRSEKFDGVIWYSPSIFLGPLANHFKRTRKVSAYLIIRDIFPEWAVDMGLMGRGLPYLFFKRVAEYQYSVADFIGVQTPGNLAFFENWSGRPGKRVEVLPNWLTQAAPGECCIDISSTALSGRKIFVYAGNMGVAQGMDILLDVAAKLSERRDIGFVFVGRGSEAARMRDEAARRLLDNVLFFDEVSPDEISGLYAQCAIGLVALDPRHRTHNIPGKFLSYMHCGIPVLASVNPGNDLVDLIEREGVGAAVVTYDASELAERALELLLRVNGDPSIAVRCVQLAHREFSSAAAVEQIVTALGESR